MKGEGLGLGPHGKKQLLPAPIPPAGTSAVRIGLGHCWQLTSLSFHGTQPSVSHLAGAQCMFVARCNRWKESWKQKLLQV